MKRTFYQYVHRVRARGLALIGGLCLITQLPAQAQQQLVWEENFNGTTINPATWTFDQGDGCAQGVCGWGNSELETYTNRPENARVEGGNLIIEARRENYQGKSFTSARLKTLGRVQFKYGTLEARIKVPNLQNGLWPAFWMLGATGTWPASGEVDIMEMGSAAAIQAGLTNRRLGGATHWENAGTHAAYDTHYDSPTDLTADYHVYRMSWDSQLIRMFIDGTEYYAIDISKAAAADLEEFHQAQYILLNLAVGGQYTGIYDPNAITAPLPGQMLVDYIRLYQSPGDELYLGTNNSIAGDFGIYTENPAIPNRLRYGQDANLYLWNNLTNLAGATPFEGQEVLALRANAGSWFGFGVDNQVKNLAAFANGSLKFQFKTTYAGQFKFGMKSGAGESWVDFPAGSSKYGLVRDGQWHEVVLPLSAFNNGDLAAVTQTFMFAGDAASSQADFYFDHIYYSGGVAANPAPTVSLTSPAPEALITTPATLTLTANAADANGSVTKVEFYSGFTLVGTATTAPYSATWPSVAPGTYTLTAKATDNEGVVTTSAPVTVFVAAPNNADPAVSLTAPTATTSFTTPATITLEANATDADGSVYKVEFYNGTTLLGTDFTSPHTYTWSGVAAGTYSLTAKVTDNGKRTTTSAAVSITVRSNVMAGPNFGVYTDNAQMTDKLALGQDANLYIWNNLSPLASPTPFEGPNVLALRASAGNWFGFGIANDIKNLAAFKGGALKFQFKTTYGGQFKFGVKTGGAEGWVDFPAGATQFGLQRDGQWHEVSIPLQAFGNLDWATLEQALMFAGDAPAAPADFYFDNVYYNTQPVVVAPVTYCGTAASGDYSYAVTTTGTSVNFTFHPLGSVAGGNLAILYVNGPGYSMTKNAAGDFTYTLPNQTAGQALSFYFTYAVPGAGERNSAATPHSYTVGTPCGSTPAPAAPTVSLTSPAASASFTAPATITLTATAADTDGTITKVEFYQGTTLLGTSTASPYSFTWTGAAAGSYSLTAKAFDNAGLSAASAAVAVTVTGGSAPGGNMGYCGTAANGDYSWQAVTTGSSVAFTFHPLGATAGGNLAIVYVNGPGYMMSKNSAGDFTYTVPNQTNGTVLNVYFTYQVGPGGPERNSAATPHAYTVGASCGAAPVNAAPTVALTSPTATSFPAPATITLTASASDSDGTISKVEFYQGTTLLGSDATAPYSFTWGNVPVGAYSLTAKAFDDKNLSTTSTAVLITVAVPDADNDGYPADQDCDDNNAAVHPGLVFYADADGDGFGNAAAPPVTACATPAGYTLRAGDCNDQDAAINPAAQDACGQDRNCDGKLDLPAQVAPTVAVQPTSTVQTGGPATTIYLGYGAQNVQLTASAAAATSYTWSPATGLSASTGASVVVTPTAAGSYTYTVTARNAAGCTAEATVTITVIDARGVKHSDKVRVCHQGQVLEISAPAVAAHLSHGDKLGSCSTVAARPAAAATAGNASALTTTALALFPNPAQNRVSLEVALAQDATYSLAIYDLKGTLVKTISSGQAAAGQRLSLEWNATDYAQGVYLVRLTTEKEVISKRLIIQH
ncbi:Ig-like domain-containing protein [Hymenobacter glacieicola]|uniref:Ig-like domain-containing protein n=1 Tax=Hymenobacter glacieicola TaxID=1562124 RepID=UPI001669CBD2|nr:Ig-like domain-containing protein [Hymenobacter glacieicola]